MSEVDVPASPHSRQRIGAPPAGFGADERVVLFDGVCKVCSRWVRFLVKRDPNAKLKLCSLQSPEGQAILKHLGRPLEDFDTMIFLEGGQDYDRSTALLKILRRLPAAWPLLYAGIILPRSLRDFLYNLVARNRYRIFGRNATCMVPTPELKAHFLGED